FRMELHGKNIGACRGSGKTQAVLAATGDLVFRQVHHAVTVHKIETREILDTFPHGMRFLLHLVPAHVRHFQALAEFAVTLTEMHHATGKQAKAFDAVVFLAAFHQRLHADTDTKQRLTTGSHFKNGLVETAGAQFLHAVTDRADTGKYDPVGGNRHRRIGGHDNTLAISHFFQCFRGRVQIAHAVIEYGNCFTHNCLTWFRSGCPWWTA